MYTEKAFLFILVGSYCENRQLAMTNWQNKKNIRGMIFIGIRL